MDYYDVQAAIRDARAVLEADAHALTPGTRQQVADRLREVL